MTDLPVLEIGCGKLLSIHSGKEDEQVPCGKKGKLFLNRLWLCNLCQYNLDAVKAHAASYDKDANTFAYAEGARDAVLKLAGLTQKDLED